jgi:DNA-binding response OmpR family regulator
MEIQATNKILSSLNVLYVESNIKFKINLTNALKLKVKNVFDTDNLISALMIYNEMDIDIIITDINVNEVNDGISFIKRIRNSNKNIPIIVISSSTELSQIIRLIKYDLVDYIFKPIPIKTLRIALENSVERILYKGIYVVKFKNNIKYHINQNRLTKEDKIISLTVKEQILLNTLIKNQNYILSKEEIKDLVWENGYDVTDTAFKSLMNRLRVKIGKESIKNSSGNGYILDI